MHGANAPSSSEHSNVAAGSPENSNRPVVLVTVPCGPPVTAGASGAVASTVMVTGVERRLGMSLTDCTKRTW